MSATLPTSSTPYVSITAFGAVADGVTNNQTAIQDALNYAAAHGCAVYIPAGTFAYSGTLSDNGVAVYGAGTTSILKALSGANEALILTGTGASVSNIQMDGTGSTRLTTPQSGMIYADGAQNYTIENVLINGSSSIGIMSADESSGGQIVDNTVENTLADSITQIEGASNILVQGNRILNAGDDAISNNSYVGFPLVNNITITGNTVLNNLWGHPVEISGGSNITISGNYFQNSDGGATVYIDSDLTEWNTQGVSNVSVTGNTLVGGGPDEGSVIVLNDSGSSYAISGVTISGNQFVDPDAVAVQYGGDGAESGITQNNTVYTSNSFSLTQNALASFTGSNNQVDSTSAYTTPLVAPGGGVTAVPTPTPTSTPTPTASPTPTPTPTSAPTGTLTLDVSENAYQGNAQFVVSVDGVQVGGTLTASALHSSGDSNVFSLSGDWSQGSNSVKIQFLNAENGGSSNLDRNLYVNAIGLDGTTYADTSATMMSDGTDSFTIGAGTAAAAPPADTLTLYLSEDAWKGNARFTLTIDGKSISTPQSVTTLHSSGQWESFVFAGNFGAGNHTVGVSFTNDAYGGSPSEDRNLYVNGINVNGQSYGNGVTALMSDGTATFKITTFH